MIRFEVLEEIYKLKNLIRYNNRTKLKDESVAEHSFFVALISLMICDTLGLDKDTTSECLIKAVLHDMPEIEMNDITHDVKERLKLGGILQEYECEYYDKHFKNFASLMNFEDGSISSIIVQLADAESVRQFIQNEKKLGNQSKDIFEIDEECGQRISRLEDALYEKLRRERHE